MTRCEACRGLHCHFGCDADQYDVAQAKLIQQIEIKIEKIVVGREGRRPFRAAEAGMRGRDDPKLLREQRGRAGVEAESSIEEQHGPPIAVVQRLDPCPPNVCER